MINHCEYVYIIDHFIFFVSILLQKIIDTVNMDKNEWGFT